MAAPPRDLPRKGTLAATPLPRLLLGLWRGSFSGTLELVRARRVKRFKLAEGAPVSSESNAAGESLGAQLVAAERIRPEDLERVSEHVEQAGVGEAAALLALSIVEPKELVLALRDQLRRRLVDCFGWPEGRYALETGVVPGEDAQAFRVDPLRVVEEGLTAHWSPDRLLADLEPRLSRYARPTERFDALAARLQPGPDRDALVEAIEPDRCFGEAVYTAPTADRLAAAWLLAESGALEFLDGPPRDDAAEAAGPATELDIEIEVRRRPARSSVATDDARGEPEDDALSPEAEALRKDLLQRHEQLDQLDHYEVLGVASDAPDAAIRKAYLGLAKRFHPDALARMGLGSLRREANELFAQIAQAQQTLSTRRKAYDDARNGQGPAVDASRVAQAESLFRKGEVLIKVGNFSGALDFLRPCVELWPEEADYQGALGWALYKASPSQPDAAREHLEHANELKPDDAVLVFRLGMVLRKLGEAERAQALLDEAKALEKAARG